MTLILALDPAKLTGFCHSCGFRGFWDLGEPTYRLARLEALVNEFPHPFDVLAAEDAQIGSPNFVVQGSHAEYRGVLRLIAQKQNVDFVLVHPTSVKAWATGSGRAKKTDMIRHAQLQYGIDIKSEDEADAFWICQYVLAGQHLKTKKVQRQQEKSRRKKETKLFK